MNTVFLAKLYDRHVDDSYAAFVRLEDAITQCEKWVSEYEERYEWIIPAWNWKGHWKFYKESGEDGPRVSVEE
ncbi:MAG TPA: hypothetical protein VIY48_19580, partial [Candidatus Paceibacterota bacterium]